MNERCPKCKGPKDHPEGSSACNRILLQKKSGRLSITEFSEALEAEADWPRLKAHDLAQRAKIRMLKLRETRLKGLADSWQRHAADGLAECERLRDAVQDKVEYCRRRADEQRSVDQKSKLAQKFIFCAAILNSLLNDDEGGGPGGDALPTDNSTPTAPSSDCTDIPTDIGTTERGDKCPTCNGTGSLAEGTPEQMGCAKCDGAGETNAPSSVCPECGGAGYETYEPETETEFAVLANHACPTCNGTGKTEGT